MSKRSCIHRSLLLCAALVQVSCLSSDGPAAVDTGEAARVDAAPAAQLLPPKATGQPPDVLLITIDTLRADHLPLHGYTEVETPHLDALAKDAVVFDKAAAHTPITLPSHASILTGLYPPQHGVRNNGSFYAVDELTTITEVLAASGYRTGGFVSAFVLDSRFGLDQGFATYDDDLVDGRRKFSKFGVKDRRAANTVGRVLDWLDGKGPGGGPGADPFFAWVHLYDPHYEYEPPEPYRSRYAHPYDGEIAYTDAQVGRLLDELKRRQRFDDTLIVVTGDHGESLGEHGESTHSIFVYEATQWVPLIVKLPGSKHGGRRFGGLVRHVDIVPTVLEVIAPPKVPEGFSAPLLGTSLLSRMSGDETAPVDESYAEAYLPKDQFGWAPLFAWRDDTHKYIEAPTPELYELVPDPAELTNRHGEQATRAATLTAKLAALQAKLVPVVGGSAGQEMDEETTAKLKALGYIGASEASPTEAGKDPKEMVHLYEARERAHHLMEHGRYAEAIPLLEQVAAEDPTNPSTHSDLGSVFAELQRWPEAERHYRRAAELAPNRAGAHQGLAKVHFKGTRNFAAAAEEIELAFALAPNDPTLWTLRGDFLHEQGKMKLAAAAYQRAVDGGEQNASLYAGFASALTNLRRYERARQMVDEALRIDNQNGVAHYNRGVILEQLGELAEASAAYRESLRWHPDNPLAYENLGHVLEQTGHADEARSAYEAGLQRAPANPGLLYALGSLHVSANRFEDGIALLERAVAAAPGAAPARTNLGYAYHQLGRIDDAFVQYRALTRIYPKNKMGFADAWMRMARLRAQQGRTAEARELLGTALEAGGAELRKAAAADPDLGPLLGSE